MANQDFALSGNDILISNGDFVIGQSDTQHIADTLNAFPGWWKEYPADGIGIFQYFNSAGKQQVIKREIQIQLTADGYTVPSPTVTISANGGLLINPNAVAK